MILLVDNDDSFVHNLARYFRRLGCETAVVRSDRLNPETCRDYQPHGIVISPGPKHPDQTGHCVEIIRELGPEIPILGVCLGHQAIGVAFGATVIPCEPVHGIATPIHHDGRGLFQDIKSPMRVARYHSLAIDPESIASPLIVTARSADHVVMGIRHREFPIDGVQFHPESILTDHGCQLIDNFVDRIQCVSNHRYSSDRLPRRVASE